MNHLWSKLVFGLRFQAQLVFCTLAHVCMFPLLYMLIFTLCLTSAACGIRALLLILFDFLLSSSLHFVPHVPLLSANYFYTWLMLPIYLFLLLLGCKCTSELQQLLHWSGEVTECWSAFKERCFRAADSFRAASYKLMKRMKRDRFIDCDFIMNTTCRLCGSRSILKIVPFTSSDHLPLCDIQSAGSNRW